MTDSVKQFLLSKVEYIIIGMLFIIFMMWSISKVGKKEQKEMIRIEDIIAINFTLADIDTLREGLVCGYNEGFIEEEPIALHAKLDMLEEVIRKNEEIQEQDDKKVSE